MREKKPLLFISPIVPQKQGNGLAMRAGAWLRALAPHYRIYVLVVPISDPRETLGKFPFRELVEDIEIVPFSWFDRGLNAVRRIVKKIFHMQSSTSFEQAVLTSSIRSEAKHLFEDLCFDAIFVFRLYLDWVLKQRKEKISDKTELLLDLDDIESETRQGIAGLYRLNGESEKALNLENDARLCEKMEQELLPKYSTVFVCSKSDRKILANKYNLNNVKVAPNTVEVPEVKLKKVSEAPFTFLFVGNLNYYPNLDAVRYFANEILPIIRKLSVKPFRFRIVGPGDYTKLRGFSEHSDIDLVGRVEHVAECYQHADAVVVPLRAGGGTRIKVLEAFSYNVPVISTSIGASGIEVEEGNELLLADSPVEFAEKCVLLMKDEDLSSRLTKQAFACVSSRYSHQALVDRLQ